MKVAVEGSKYSDLRAPRAPQFQPATMALISMPRLALLALGCAVWIAIGPAEAFKKKKKEDETQTLQVPKDPPGAVVAETRRLVFHVTPLSAGACFRSRSATP